MHPITADWSSPIATIERRCLSDIAEVNDSVQSLRNAGSINGKSAVTLVIYKQPGANVIQTVDRIKAILPVLKASMPGGTEMIVTGDRTVDDSRISSRYGANVGDRGGARHFGRIRVLARRRGPC